ncbi:hypothetical protein SteCoe_6507 [Stentor coeruleus]|uniref:Cyclic nucleotide-binding domain-containing protein n=1 Tax=Stentor coeruleus TaxID=5963 RepID=A0A1R2CPX2_9CILI|nr:hypothetical protein SteCoe_6507 [Stentor coeruleus]
MERDKKICEYIKSLNSTAGYKIFKPQALLPEFYFKSKKLQTSNSSPLLNKTLPPLKNQPSKTFMTQLPNISKNKKTSFTKIFATCLKNKEEREYSEVIEVAKWLRDVIFFYPMSRVKLQKMGKVLSAKHYRRGEYLYLSNHPLQYLYIILNGDIDIILNNKKVDVRSLRDVVGENGLLDKTNSQCSARASTEVHVLYINITTFYGLLGSDQMKYSLDLMKILRNVELFSSVSTMKLSSLANRLKLINVTKGSIIYNYRQNPVSFFILTNGMVHEKIKTFSDVEDIKELKPGDHFGSRDLIFKCPRRSNAVAASNCVLYEVPRMSNAVAASNCVLYEVPISVFNMYLPKFAGVYDEDINNETVGSGNGSRVGSRDTNSANKTFSEASRRVERMSGAASRGLSRMDKITRIIVDREDEFD